MTSHKANNTIISKTWDLDAKIARLHQEVATFDENARERDTRDAVVKKTKRDRGWLIVTIFFVVFTLF